MAGPLPDLIGGKPARNDRTYHPDGYEMSHGDAKKHVEYRIARFNEAG